MAVVISAVALEMEMTINFKEFLWILPEGSVRAGDKWHIYTL